MIDCLCERDDFLSRMCHEYLLTFLKVQQLKETISQAVRGTGSGLGGRWSATGKMGIERERT